MKKIYSLGLLILFSGFMAMSAFGIMVEYTLKNLTMESTDIVSGKVTGKASHWNEAKTQIVTDVTVKIDKAVKGQAKDSIIVQYPGGAITNSDGTGIGMGRSETPECGLDEEVFLFLAKDQKSGLFKVTADFQGKFKLVTDKATGKKMVESGAKVLVSPETMKAREVQAYQVPLDDLIARINNFMDYQK
jgi:hypothetical protein